MNLLRTEVSFFLFITNIWTKPVMPFLARRRKIFPDVSVALLRTAAPGRPSVSAAEIAAAPGQPQRDLRTHGRGSAPTRGSLRLRQPEKLPRFRNGPAAAAPRQGKERTRGRAVSCQGQQLSLQLLSAPAESGRHPLLCWSESEESLTLPRPRRQVGNSFLLLGVSDDTHTKMSLVAGDS